MDHTQIIGEMNISGFWAITLINTGYSHSLISPTFARDCGFKEDSSTRFIEVVMGSRKHCHILDRSYPGLYIDQGYRWKVEPLAGKTAMFHLILGRDWLKQHSVVMDAQQEIFYFWPPNGFLATGLFHTLEKRKMFVAFQDGTNESLFYRQDKLNTPSGWMEAIKARAENEEPVELEDPLELSDDGPTSEEDDDWLLERVGEEMDEEIGETED